MDTLKYFFYKIVKVGLIILVMAFLYAACDSIFGEEKNPEKTWYWADQCLQDRITYRTWEQNDLWSFELANDMKGDAMITYEIIGDKIEEHTQIIKSGDSSGILTVYSEECPNVRIVSVVMMKDGRPDYILNCE